MFRRLLRYLGGPLCLFDAIPVSMFLAACGLSATQVTAIASGIVQDACPLVGLLNGQAGTVCADVAPLISSLVGGVVATADARPCKLAPITADGLHGRGVICVDYCGDMTSATTADPCPRVDAALRKAAR